MQKARLIDEDVRQAHWRAIIIGTGFGGLGMAISLKKNGISNFLVLDKAGEVGGVWRDNSYPGAACDVPSQLYSFSFEPNPNWSHTFARQSEILTYLRHCAVKYGIYQHIRFRSEVIKAEFKEDQQLWAVTLSDGSTLATQFLVTATGQLSLPYIPEIEGRNSFLGHSFHSAQWDHELPLENKRVAVIGTGASSIQIVPAIAKQVKELILFQRSAPYVLPRGDRAIPSWLKKLYSTAPLSMSLQRLRFYLQYELRALGLTLFKRLLTLYQYYFLSHLHSQVMDTTLRSNLLPDYPIGCKRILISDNFYSSLEHPHVTLVKKGIHRITKNGIITNDGETYHVDVIIFATGFCASKFLFPIHIVGRNSAYLNDYWHRGAAAYLGITVPGYPNFFMLYGPNTNLGHNSIVYMLESQFEHILRILMAMEAQNASCVDVDEPKYHYYQQRIAHRLQKTAWSGCRSWYVNEHGLNTTNWPGFTFTYRWLTKYSGLDAYSFSSKEKTTATLRIAAPTGWGTRLSLAAWRCMFHKLFRTLIELPLGVRFQRTLFHLFTSFLVADRDVVIEKQYLRKIPVEVLLPKASDVDQARSSIILYIHGGGFCLGSPKAYRALTSRLSVASDAMVWVPDYRLAPEYHYPAGLNDVMECYQSLLDKGYSPKDIVLAGDSAGAALILALAHMLSEKNQPQPAGLMLISPWTDLSLHGPTISSRRDVDPVLCHSSLQRWYNWYGRASNDHVHHSLEQNLETFPQMLIQVGDREILLSDSTLLAKHADHYGVQCQLEIYEELWHSFHLFAGAIPQAEKAIRRLGRFFRDCIANQDDSLGQSFSQKKPPALKRARGKE